MNLLLLVTVICLLAGSSILNHINQNKAIVQCHERKAQLRDRLQQAIRTFARQQDSEKEKEAEDDVMRTARTVSLLTEFMQRKQAEANASDIIRSQYLDCSDKLVSLNETCTLTIQSLQHRINMAEDHEVLELQAARKQVADLTERMGRVINETAELKTLSKTEIERARVRQKIAEDRNEELVSEISQLRAELQRLQASTTRTTGGILIDDDSLSPPLIIDDAHQENHARPIPIIIDEPLQKRYDHPSLPQHKQHYQTEDEDDEEFEPSESVPQHFEPKRIVVLRDCAKLSFEFNKKRLGTTYDNRIATSANRCKRICLSDDMCQAWTYVSETSECLLKQDIGDSVESSCCVSGIRCERL